MGRVSKSDVKLVLRQFKIDTFSFSNSAFIRPVMKAARLYSLIEGFGLLCLKEIFWNSLQHKAGFGCCLQ